MTIQCTKDDIARKLYPVDNSWCLNLSGDRYNQLETNPYLAGNNFGGIPKLVTIISEPYVHKIQAVNPEEPHYDREFVTVEYEGNYYRILNIFVE